MSWEIANLIKDYLALNDDATGILTKCNRQLTRKERRIYYQKIDPKAREIKLYLKDKITKLNTDEKEELKHITINSLLKNGGEPDLSDTFSLDILGRLEIYKAVREEAKNKNISLKVGSTSGGCITFIIIVTTIILIISFLYSKL